jgi:hypothetical protein
MYGQNLLIFLDFFDNFYNLALDVAFARLRLEISEFFN